MVHAATHVARFLISRISTCRFSRFAGDCIGSKELWRRNDEKRIISLLMTFCLVFSVMPTSSAMAESEEADITGGTRQSGGVPVYVCAETMY